MTDRPPSPATPASPSTAATDTDRKSRIVTTAQLTAALEESLGYRPDEGVLEDALLELDRLEYVEWVAVSRTGDHVWDVSETPDRIADAVAEAVVARFTAWLEGDADG